MASTKLQEYFPIIRTREQVLAEIHSKDTLKNRFASYVEAEKEEFLDICTGAKGVPILSDNYFQAVMDPDAYPERVQGLVGSIIGRNVTSIKPLQRSSFPLGDEKSLVVLDLVVGLDDGSIINLEVQKIGYAFPGQRAACYASDLMLRQYSHIKGEIVRQRAGGVKHSFSYRELKPVYTIVLIEKSDAPFHGFPDKYIHSFSQKSDTGLEMELLMNYIFVPLDIFRNNLHNRSRTSDLDDWLTFLSLDDPETIIDLCERKPFFRSLYEDIYEICRNTERMMNMYSSFLKELDHNTVDYMIDELKAENKQLRVEKEQVKAQAQKEKEALEARIKLLESKLNLS